MPAWSVHDPRLETLRNLVQQRIGLERGELFMLHAIDAINLDDRPDSFKRIFLESVTNQIRKNPKRLDRWVRRSHL